MSVTDAQIASAISSLGDGEQNTALEVRTVFDLLRQRLLEVPSGTVPRQLFGSGAPTTGIGNNGDTYEDRQTGNKYLKDAGSWSLQNNVRGPAGKTPVKGVDYFDGKTPVKGVDYRDGEDGRTPVKGVDYTDGRTPVKGVDYSDGRTPVKGIDYFDGQDGKTPVKNTDYFDGQDGVTPIKGVDYFDGARGSVITASALAPSGGITGDAHFQVMSAERYRLYANVGGAWNTLYTTPEAKDLFGWPSTEVAKITNAANWDSEGGYTGPALNGVSHPAIYPFKSQSSAVPSCVFVTAADNVVLRLPSF